MARGIAGVDAQCAGGKTDGHGGGRGAGETREGRGGEKERVMRAVQGGLACRAGSGLAAPLGCKEADGHTDGVHSSNVEIPCTSNAWLGGCRGTLEGGGRLG